MKLRQHLQDHVLARHTGGEVEGEVRPETVAVREERALRPAGRAGGVDQEQAVVVLDELCVRPRVVEHEGRGGGEALEGRRPQGSSGRSDGELGELGELFLDKEERGLCVLELEAKLGGREAPVEG